MAYKKRRKGKIPFVLISNRKVYLLYLSIRTVEEFNNKWMVALVGVEKSHNRCTSIFNKLLESIHFKVLHKKLGIERVFLFVKPRDVNSHQ